jgi:Mn2+/Fe2+ NRAMP family transporter
VSFFRTLHPAIEKHQRMVVTLFILSSTLIFLFSEKPATLLILAGAVNGVILPLALGVMLWAGYKKKLMGNYRQPVWLQLAGWMVVAIMAIMSVMVISKTIASLTK